MPDTQPADLTDDLRGVSRLTIDAIIGVTDLVEAMHRNIASGSSLLGQAPEGPSSGISGLVYSSVRGVTRLVGKSLDVALRSLIPDLGQTGMGPGRDALLAALNGVTGDHLADSGNPLAIAMQLREHEPAHAATGKLAILVHGLCMNDQQWLRNGHDHGAALARELGYSPLYLSYNSGRHISVNGREFTQQLQELVARWPVPVEELVIIGHSMGGLVARSACHYAVADGHDWLVLLKKMVFLGTPHHGAPLEQAGSVIDLLLGATPYSAPLARIGLVRSAGIQDLRHGNLTDEHWGRKRPNASQQVSLPSGVQCYAIAAVQGDTTQRVRNKVLGDGLVPVDSALGQHPRASHSLGFPPDNTRVLPHMNHFDLLSRDEVYQQILDWLSPAKPTPTA
ncbi:MAG: alpha/beta hydrolase [Bdellovibrionales bacterium]|nr:alpha/beta hydrolase [Ramlibacter sp.]